MFPLAERRQGRSDATAARVQRREERREERGGATKRQSLCHEVTFSLESRWKEKTRLLAFEANDARSLARSQLSHAEAQDGKVNFVQRQITAGEEGPQVNSPPFVNTTQIFEAKNRDLILLGCLSESFGGCRLKEDQCLRHEPRLFALVRVSSTGKAPDAVF